MFDAGDGTYAGGANTTASAVVPGSVLDTVGVHTIVGRIIAKDGAYTNYTTTINVTNVAPVVATMSPVNATVGSLFTDAGFFTDPGVGENWTATVDYGDGVGGTPAPQTLTLNADKTFNLSHTYTAVGAYTVTVTVSDHPVGSPSLSGTASFLVTVAAPAFVPFQVGSFSPTTSGFDVTFNRAANMGEVHLYDGLNSASGSNLNFGEPQVSGYSDVTLVGQTGGTVHGSLVWNAASDTADFVQTSGVLAPDTYTVTLASRSGSSDPGWEDTSGNLLAGGDGFVAVSNGYQMTFTVAPYSSRVLSLPCFARGPGQAVNVDAHGTALGTNLPVFISDGSNVESFDFELDYNPSLLNISNVALDSAVPAGWTLHFSNDSSSGTLTVSAFGNTPLSGGSQTIVDLTASVPNSGPIYGASEVLNLTNVEVGSLGGPLSALGDEAVHKVMYFADAAGTGARPNSFDALLVNRCNAKLDTGFYAAPLTDPVILGDVGGVGKLNSYDALLVSQYAAHVSVPQIPAPGTLLAGFAAIDPTVQIGSGNTVATPGQTVDTSVRITDDPHGLQAADFTISYDASLLSLSAQDVQLGKDLAGKGWSVVENIDGAAGIAYISMIGSQPLTAGTPQLLDLTFHVRSGAVAGTSPLDITGVSTAASW